MIGHSGFTGTTVLADRRDGTVAVLLSNRVHPHRELYSVMAARRALAARAFAHRAAASSAPSSRS